MNDLRSAPRVSIIMATHNHGLFIEEAVRSVLNQEWPHWELIIVDDASTDDTPARLAQFTDPRICYKKVDRFGRPSKVRNYGIKLASGEYITFLDADDVMLPNTLSSYLTAMRENPTFKAVYGFIRHIDENGQPLPSAGYKLIPLPNGGYRLPSSYKHTYERIALSRLVGNPCLMVERETLLKVGLFDETLEAAEDIHLYQKLFLHDPQCLHCIPEYVLLYRRNMNSLTRRSGNMDKLLRSHLRVAEDIFNHDRMPRAVRLRFQSRGMCKPYTYVAGLCLTRRDRAQAFDLLFEAFNNPHIRLPDWVRECFPLLLRSLLPYSLERRMKVAAVALRDGVFLARLKNGFKSPNWRERTVG